MPAPVIIVDYDPSWPELFELLREKIAGVVGELALTIEHVGSASVPGLAAKPIIDIDIVIDEHVDPSSIIRRLETLGYAHEGDGGIPGREAFSPPPGGPCHHLYLCSETCPAYLEHILFRDYLRSHPDAATAYGELKKQLAERYRTDRVGYGREKTEFVTGILQLARESGHHS